MIEQEIIARMDEAAKEDRERFFAVADTLHLQPKYKDRLQELEVEKQRWRDMTLQPSYPQMKWPMELPVWFPPVRFASCWEADYLEKTLKRETRAQK
ncbi:MAG: hypothetical protein RSA20_09200 [Oscillospiraceae bacterium]